MSPLNLMGMRNIIYPCCHSALLAILELHLTFITNQADKHAVMGSAYVPICQNNNDNRDMSTSSLICDVLCGLYQMRFLERQNGPDSIENT